MIDKNTLEALADAIMRIEKKDFNYQENDTWQKLRKMQEDAFKEYAKQEIEYSKTRYISPSDTAYISKINSYKSYLNKTEGKNKNE